MHVNKLAKSGKSWSFTNILVLILGPENSGIFVWVMEAHPKRLDVDYEKKK